MIKLDQTFAWIIAIMVASGIYGTGYFVLGLGKTEDQPGLTVKAEDHPHGDDHHGAASHDEHSAPAAAHEDKHAAPSHEAHGDSHENAHKKETSHH